MASGRTAEKKPQATGTSVTRTNVVQASAQLSLRPVRLFVIETLLYQEIAELSDDDRNELKRRCRKVLQEWRASHPEKLQAASNGAQDVPLEQLYGTGMAIVEEHARNALRNDVDVAMMLCLERHPPMLEVVSAFGEAAVLASVALSDTTRSGRADSLVNLLIILCSSYRDLFYSSKAFVKESLKQAAAENEEQRAELLAQLAHGVGAWHESAARLRNYVDVTEPTVQARAKSIDALARSRAKGANANRLRGQDNTKHWREMGKDFIREHPACKSKQVVEYIQSTGYGQKSDGKPYSEVHIRRVLKGLRAELRGERTRSKK